MVAPRTFALTPMSELLRSDVPNSLYNYVLVFAAPTYFLPFGRLEQAIVSGQPTFKDTFGIEHWQH